MKNLFTICLLLIFLTGCKNESEKQDGTSKSTGTEDPITTRIAYANGFQNFEDVEQLNFTFNVRVNDSLRSQRSWRWFPREDRVELTENGTSTGYINDGDLTEEEMSIDQKFINDTYWLLFPYQLVWSEYEFDHSRSAVAPISQQRMEQVTISFPNEGGYTPGDSYHLFLRDDIIQEWTYVSSGGRTLSTTWEDYETFNGITISKMHRSQDGSFELFFTDVAVRIN